MIAAKGLIWRAICLFFIITWAACKQDTKPATETAAVPVPDSTATAHGVDLSMFEKEGDAYKLPWSLLMNVSFEEKYSEKLGMDVSLPVFNDTLKSLDGKLVLIEGFYIPVDETGNDKIVILSAYPFSQCFFCGKAGVESIIDILSPTKLPHMKVDSKIRFKGRFKLNRDNFDYLIYVLEQAEMVK